MDVLVTIGDQLVTVVWWQDDGVKVEYILRPGESVMMPENAILVINEKRN